MEKVTLRALTFLSAVVFLNVSSRTEAAIINASSASLSAVQAAVNSASAGDTVQVPGGSVGWSSPLTVTNDIQLIGAGTGVTVISNNVPAGGGLISWSTVSNGFARLSGFTFILGSTTANNYDEIVHVSGTCKAFRVDHCDFSTLPCFNLYFTGWVYGVVDHCNFYNNQATAIDVEHEAYGGKSYGDGSWADGDYWGTTNAMYIENCSFTNNFDGGAAAIDSIGGGRWVFRYNFVTNTDVASHGTESSQRYRSVRSYEIYNNNFFWNTNGPLGGIWPWAVYLRGGTGIIYSNTVLGGIAYMVVMDNYRDYTAIWPPWGAASGVNGWDSNSVSVLASGTATGPNNSTNLVDSSRTWTINQWANDFVVDTTSGASSWILTNGPTFAYVSPSFANSPPAGATNMEFNLGDAYQVHQIYATLDQCGFGQGDLIADAAVGIPSNTVTHAVRSWPHEVSDPVYIWGNSLTMLLPGNPNNNHGNSAKPTIQSNRDWVDGTPKPSYTPLVYPHPLVTATNAPPPPPSYTLTVVNGTGSGTYNSNTIVAITTNTLYSAELFKYWSGSYIANTNASSTTVIMPASNLTVTANYIPLPPVGLAVMSGQ